MRLAENYPTLPPGTGSLWSHNTGGEHATKFIGMHKAVNSLGEQSLITSHSVVLNSYSGEEFYGLLLGNNTEVVLVGQIPDGEKSPMSLAGFAIGRRDFGEGLDSRTTIERIGVRQELRGLKIASYMIGRLIEHPMATELALDSSNFEIPDWFRVKLEDVGLTHTTEDGSPALWTPGRYPMQLNVSEVDLDNALGKMPVGWFGVINIVGNDEKFDNRVEVYRDASRVGLIRNDRESFGFDDEIGASVGDFRLYDAGDVEIIKLEQVTAREAMLNLLNMHSLVRI